MCLTYELNKIISQFYYPRLDQIHEKVSVQEIEIAVILMTKTSFMLETIEEREINERTVELKKFADVYVVYAWPRERISSLVRIDELGVFENLEDARYFISTLTRI